MENIENKNNLKEKLVSEFLDKYFSNQIENETGEIKTIEIKREELNKLIEAGESVENLLYKTSERGYIFHGTPENLKTLSPSKGECAFKGKGNELTAIYATNQPSIAIFHAVMPQCEIKGKFIRAWHGHRQINNGKTNIFTTFEMNEDAYNDFLKNPRDGYVYILKRSDLKQIDPVQFIYEKKYIPTHKILVKKEDFKYKIETIQDK